MTLPGDLSYYTAEYVTRRLEQAGKALLALPNSGCRPAGLKSNWPEYAVAAAESQGLDPARVRPSRPSAAAITAMDEAYSWISLVDVVATRKTLIYRSMVDPATDRNLWPWRKLGEKLGIHRDTLKNTHARGIDRIVSTLNRRG